jgi:hypothetical protein
LAYVLSLQRRIDMADLYRRALDRLSDTIDGRRYCIATGMSGHLEDMLVPPWPAVGLA